MQRLPSEGLVAVGHQLPGVRRVVIAGDEELRRRDRLAALRRLQEYEHQIVQRGVAQELQR